MIIGVPREIKDNEFRVAMVPAGVRAAVGAGHRVVIEGSAGLGSSITDAAFREAGAEILPVAAEVFERAELIVKVKEPLPEEFKYLRSGLTVFTFLHLAANKPLFNALIEQGVTAVAYETIELTDGRTPVLEPMSEVAGRLSVQIGADLLLKSSGGSGVLLSGVPGVARGKVLIIGAGVVGQNALKIAVGLGAEVTIINKNIGRLRRIDEFYGTRVGTIAANAYNIEEAVRRADLVIGAVHVPGARTPKLVTRQMVGSMKKGSVIVDVSVDQGGAVETTRPTTHSEPVFVLDGVLHYGVTNMPGAVPRTSTYALTNATLPYLLKIASGGLKGLLEDPALLSGVNTHAGKVVNNAVGSSFGEKSVPLQKLI